MDRQDLTDEQILASLISKRDKLTIQLSKINIAISAFEDDDFSQKLPNRSSLAAHVVEIPQKYEISIPYTDKILYVLKQLKAAFVGDIVDFILQQEPDKHKKDELHHRITQTASRLYGQKKIGAVRVGRKFKYITKSPNKGA